MYNRLRVLGYSELLAYKTGLIGEISANYTQNIHVLYVFVPWDIEWKQFSLFSIVITYNFLISFFSFSIFIWFLLTHITKSCINPRLYQHWCTHVIFFLRWSTWKCCDYVFMAANQLYFLFLHRSANHRLSLHITDKKYMGYFNLDFLSIYTRWFWVALISKGG